MMIHFALLLSFLLMGEASSYNDYNIVSAKNNRMKYAGPLIYNNLPPPVIHFPPPQEVPRGFYKAPTSHSMRFVPLPYNDLPVLIYHSDNNPPIHIVSNNQQYLQDGESSQYHNEYRPTKETSNKLEDDLLAQGSDVSEIQLGPALSPVRALFQKEPIYIDSPPAPHPIYISRPFNDVRKHKGMLPRRVMEDRTKVIHDLDTSDSDVSVNTLQVPIYQNTKAYAGRPIFSFTKRDYLGNLLTTILGGITSTSYNINKFLGLLPQNQPLPAGFEDKLKEHKLRRILGLKSPRFSVFSGYGNQAIDPEYASLLSDEVTQSFIDEISNYGNYGWVKYSHKYPKHKEEKPKPLKDDSKEEMKKEATENKELTVPTTTSTTTETPVVVQKKPPIIVFQGIRPPVYMYRRPIPQNKDETTIIKPPLPQYKPPQALYEEAPPAHKIPLLSDPKSKEEDTDTLIISKGKGNVEWKPLSEAQSETEDDTVIDLSNHKIEDTKSGHSYQVYKD